MTHPTSPRRWQAAFLAAAILVTCGAPSARSEDVAAVTAVAESEESAPAAAIDALHETLLAVMKESEELGYQGRYDKLEPAIVGTFDLQFMGEKSAGRHWKSLEESDRARWLDTFRRLTIASYAGRFEGYSGQRFETLGNEAAAHDTVVVRTKLVDPTDEDVQLNYRLREAPDGWRIIDIYLHGTVSELALRRAEYSSALERDGFEKLLTELDRKVIDFSTGETK